jgi:hypothetical protein
MPTASYNVYLFKYLFDELHTTPIIPLLNYLRHILFMEKTDKNQKQLQFIINGINIFMSNKGQN